MMHGKVDLNLYIVLRAIYQEGSITAAANRLHLTQPAVSHALARLRKNLDDALFIRNGRKMVPTPFCQTVITKVLTAISTLEATATEHHTFDINTVVKQVNLGLRDILEFVLLPALIPDLLEHTPGITVNSTQISTLALESSLTRQHVDIAIDVLTPTSKHIHSEFLCHEHFVLICAPHHPIVSNTTLEQFTQAAHALVTLKNSKVDTIDVALARYHASRNIVMRCEHYFAAASAVSRSNLLLTIPSRYAKQIETRFDVKVLPLPFTVPQLDIHMYWHEDQHEDLVNQWMRTKLHALI